MLNKVICGDCLEVMRGMDDNSVDLVVTSPPYNKNGFRNGKKDTERSSGKYKRWDGAKIDYDIFDDNMEENEYKNWQIQVLNEIYRILKDSGSLFWNHKVRRFENKADHPLIWASKSKLKFYQQIIWDRGGGCDQNINYCTPTTELILWFVKNKPQVFKNKIYLTEIWRMNFDISNHPAPFPKSLVERCLLLASKENDTILDPFLGSGTTCVAAKELGRRYIGIEISQKYVDIANRRLAQEVLNL